MKKIIFFLGIAIIVFSFASCTSLSIGSYIAVYRGKITGLPTPVDTTINVYGGSPPILRDGLPRDGFKPQHPDTNGFFFVGLTSANYGELDNPPPHWEGGPFEIYIEHPTIQPLDDTLSKDELKALSQITPEEAGIKLDKIEKGVWALPDIVLKPK